jgi:hypothetical protein
MKRFEITPNQFRVADFITWQREKTLKLSPPFQRRSVWKAGAKSFFIDTLARGLPVPLIFIRERIDLEKQTVVREIVDGQQRLRTVFSFVDARLLDDFSPATDKVLVRKDHNPDLAEKPFGELPKGAKNQILGYRFSVYTLPPDVEDRDVLQMFARLNATGVRLNHQELRNAEWFGEFKSTMYSLAYEQLERWMRWGLFPSDKLSRMQEVEFVSDLVVNMRQGLTGKSQAVLGKYYRTNDEHFPQKEEIARRFRRVMDVVDDVYGARISQGAFTRVMHFFTLFAYLYDKMYGLGSTLNRRAPDPVPANLPKHLALVDARFRSGELPRRVAEAVAGAATDVGKRRTRLEFLAGICDGKAR